MRCVFVVVLLLLAGCASVPRQTQNVCAIFEQRDGLINNWKRAAYKVEREYGVPVPVLMATVYTESGFRHNARPPRTWLLGFIPWKRQSTAYGFSQALDGTWARYKRETGRWTANRTNFADALRFIGWYHYQSHLKAGIALNDPYRLYIAYYHGHAGYKRGNWSATSKTGAKRAASITANYARQIRSCGSGW